MKGKIKITSLKLCDGNEREFCLIGYMESGELEVLYGKVSILQNLFIGSGDTVNIEYIPEENKPKEIEKITKWRIGNMKEKLIKIIDECIME